MVAWESLTHQQKEDQLWNDITAPDNVGKFAPLLSLPDTMSKVLPESMITTFDSQWDVLPSARHKVIHTQGALAKFDLDITSQSFTGLFAAGKSKGIIRMGSAFPMNTGQIFPGVAVKFLRSGVSSANFVALVGGPTKTDFNFFARNFSTQASPPAPLVKLNKFQQASDCIIQVGLSDVCKYDQDGSMAASPRFPFELLFAPAAVKFPTEKITAEELLHQLTSVPVGTRLFDVYTYSSPSAKQRGTLEKLGMLTTTSECVTSLFGDNKLFFCHQRMEEDFSLRPEWVQAATSDNCKASGKPISTWQCASPLEKLKSDATFIV